MPFKRPHLTSPFSRRNSVSSPTPECPCPGCGRTYDSGKRRPVADSCGHTRCKACVRDKQRKCPQCVERTRWSETILRPKADSVEPVCPTAHRPSAAASPAPPPQPGPPQQPPHPVAVDRQLQQPPRSSFGFTPIGADVGAEQPIVEHRPPTAELQQRQLQQQQHQQQQQPLRQQSDQASKVVRRRLPPIPGSSESGGVAVASAAGAGDAISGCDAAVTVASSSSSAVVALRRRSAAGPGLSDVERCRRLSRPLSGVGGEADLGVAAAVLGLTAGSRESLASCSGSARSSFIADLPPPGPGASGPVPVPAPRTIRPSTSLAVSSSPPVTAAAGVAVSRDARFRRSLRDDIRSIRSTRLPPEDRLPVRAGYAAARPEIAGGRPPEGVFLLTQEHFTGRATPADVDGAAADGTPTTTTMTSQVAVQRRVDASGTPGDRGPPPPDSGPGGLSLGSTASNDTGYSSIGNSLISPGRCLPTAAARTFSTPGTSSSSSMSSSSTAAAGSAGSRGETEAGPSTSSAAGGVCCAGSNVDATGSDDAGGSAAPGGEPRPSVAELRQRFQKSSISLSLQQQPVRENIVLNSSMDQPCDALPPSPDVARNDLLTRLGLLLGDSGTSATLGSGAGVPSSTTSSSSSRSHYPRSTSSPSMLRQAQQNSPGQRRAVVAGVDTPNFGTVPECRTDVKCVDSSSSSLAAECGNAFGGGAPAGGLTVTYNPTFSPGGSTGRDPSTDSVTSLVSTSTGNSISPPSTWRPPTVLQSPRGAQIASLQRPHSVNAATATGNADDGTGNFGKRRSTARLSSRGHTVQTGGARMSEHGSKAPFMPLRTQLHLTRINFEVARREPLSLYFGREWLFQDIEQELANGGPHDRGVLIVGGAGFGKTAVVEQLVELSCFGEGRNTLITECSGDSSHAYHNGKGRPLQAGFKASGSIHGSSASLASASSGRTGLSQSIVNLVAAPPLLNYDPLRRLASRIVAYHMCQIDNNITCTVPEFVHSIAAHLVRAPALGPYRDLLLSRPNIQTVLTVRQCIVNASRAFVQGILEPLAELQQSGAIGSGGEVYLIVVDALNEATFHEPDYGDTIASFITHHAELFPSCLRIVATTRTGSAEIADLPLRELSLDGEIAVRDVADYVSYRIAVTPAIQANIEPTTSSRTDAVASHVKLAAHIATLSGGCMLYVKLVLDLIERGPLVLKSSGYRVIPVNLSEVFQLEMNLRFPTTRAFERAAPILSIGLASLYPLTAAEIHSAVMSRLVHGLHPQHDDFEQVLEHLSGLLLRRRDGTFVFFHPTFREWLIRRDESESSKFLCDLRFGHALIALKMSRADVPLPADHVLELGHHILKAHIYKSTSSKHQLGVSSRDLQAYWLCLSTDSLSAALISHRNLFSPNVKVSRLLLLAGANPNTPTDILNGASPLCIAAREGYADVVSLFVEFGADVNASDDDQVPALSYAARRGHVNIIHLLTTRQAKVNQVDNEGWCPLVHAASSGQLDAVSFLLQCDWSLLRDRRPTRNEALQQALTAAARNGHTSVCEFILGLQKITGEGFSINAVDSLFGETALTAACLGGHMDTVCSLLERCASVTIPNATSQCPLLCAAGAGEWQTIDVLLNIPQGLSQLKLADKSGRSSLMLAAAEGHLSVVELLLSRGAPVMSADREGLTALSWACIRGHLHCAQLLLERGSAIDQEDKIKRTPLHLASFNGHEQVVQCLLDRGANMEHEDVSGMRPLDRAISYRHTAVVICFLRKGAKIGPSTWAMAAGKPDIMMLLLNKLLDDGNVLYKKNRIRDAAYRYQYALKKLPTADTSEDIFDADHSTFAELRVNLALNLSRCKRKLMDPAGAVELASSVLDMKPNSFEAYYARARAKRDMRQFESALQDLTTALSLAPHNRELRRLLARVEEECIQANQLNGSSQVADNSYRTSGIPDLVPDDTASFTSEAQRLKEETSL